MCGIRKKSKKEKLFMCLPMKGPSLEDSNKKLVRP